MIEYGCGCPQCGCDNASENIVNGFGICAACEAGDHIICDPDCSGPQPHWRESTV